MSAWWIHLSLSLSLAIIYIFKKKTNERKKNAHLLFGLQSDPLNKLKWIDFQAYSCKVAWPLQTEQTLEKSHLDMFFFACTNHVFFKPKHEDLCQSLVIVPSATSIFNYYDRYNVNRHDLS